MDHLNGYFGSSIMSVIQKFIERHIVFDQILTTTQLIYKDIERDPESLKYEILKALKSGNMSASGLDIISHSITIKQQESKRQPKIISTNLKDYQFHSFSIFFKVSDTREKVPLQTILLPAIFGSIGLVLFIIGILLGYFCYKRVIISFFSNYVNTLPSCVGVHRYI